MKLYILGNNGPFPAAGGACSGYLLESDSGDTKLLIDCGTGSLANLMKYTRLERLSAVILTHLHFDHMSDMLPMRYALDVAPVEQLTVLVQDSPAEVRDMLTGCKYSLEPHTDRVIGEMKVSFLPAVHPVKASCVRVECDGKAFVFTGDTNLVAGLDDFCKRADLLLADAGFMHDDWAPGKPHLSAKLCGELASKSEAGRLVLTHLNPKYSHEALRTEAAECFKNTVTAETGDIFDI